MSQIKTRSIFLYRQRAGSWYEILTHNKKFLLRLRHIPILNSFENSMLYIIFTLSIIITASETKFWLMFLIIVFRNQGGLVYQYVMLPKILSHNGCGLWNMLYTHIWKLYLFTVTNSFHVLYVFINILITKGWDSKMMSRGLLCNHTSM